ncbi:tetratricopeptide repeat protein [Actinoplanes sp. ATCC 53533]|uniref:FxSxx-COOH system tetratricopeptide repeat protein n=1 Tax=Actinoplanes sp. ATCC 53533 TaxID=1288362 RepID=UPI000F77D085|nr:FxSxx-COOH system tetratricopeptide repeat protein [Actinoplanes sp. ATCC 53533]RSM69507.1 tetratricopeptide repeat protein [Actinoplanes sp. ATCC 53533]
MPGPDPHRSDRAPDGPQPDWSQIADAIWLAAVIATEGESAPDPEPRPGADPNDIDRGGLGAAPGIRPPAGELSSAVPVAPLGALPGARDRRIGAPAEIEDVADNSLLGALPAGQHIARVLNPFKRRVRSVTENEPDEEATADFAVDSGVLLPRYRAVHERWLGLAVIVDDSPSMAVWRPTIAALRLLLERHGAFRSVRTFSLAREPGETLRLRAPSGGSRSPAELLDPAGRQLFIVLTDGYGELWREPGVDSMLRLWGSAGPLMIGNPYPRRHWRSGNLVPRRCRLRAPRVVAPNSDLQVTYPEELHNPFDPPVPPGALAVPVVELNPRWLRWWTELVTGPPGWVNGLVHVVDPGTPPYRNDPVEAVDPDTAVLHFQRSATPPAFRLATLLAAAPLDLPLLHHIQKSLLPGSAPHHLAEVLTGGLVRRSNDVGTSFEFTDGVRQSLLSCASRDDSARVLRAIAAHQPRRGRAGLTLARVIEAPDAAPDILITHATVDMARIELAVLNALSGPYAVRARRLSDAIEAFEAPAQEAVGTRGDPDQPDDPVGEPATDAAEGDDNVATQPDPERFDEGSGDLVFPEDAGFGSPGDRLLSDEEPLSLDDIFEGQGSDESPIIWGNVPTRNPVFTGRRALLEQLERRLRTQRVAAVLPQALHGEGGVGKSQIAIEYAHRHRADYDVIWWIPSERPAQILASLIELGNRLGLDVGNEVITAIPKVRAALRAGTPYGNWLLVFDNAETPETVHDYLPEAGTGKVLVTSRNQEWSQIAESLEVDVFTRDESVRLLKRRNRDLPGADAERLADALGDLPLAIEHASAWLHATGMAAGEYLRLLDEKRAELNPGDLTSGYEMPVAAAANVALDRLATENLAALQLLQVCSFFAPEPIDRDLFAGVRGAMGAGELDEVLKNPNRLNQAIRDIQRYVLARIDHRGNSLQLHRLVQKVLQDRIAPEQREFMEHGAHLLLAAAGVKLGDPADPDQWLRYQALASHLIASGAWACEDDWTRDVVLSLMKFYFYWGDYPSGRELSQRVVDDWTERLGAAHPQTLSASKLLGYYWWLEGNFDGAAAIQSATLRLYLETVGSEDEGTIDAMTMVATTMRVSGQFAAARDLDLDAFRTAQRSLGKDDPITLGAAHNLGISLRLTGEFRTARQLDADTYRRRIVVLGNDHPETLRTLNNLTIDERECGEYIRSRRMVERNYTRYVHLFGVGHQETIRIARNLAVARRRAGNHADAYKLAEDTMNRFRDRFGPTHPDTLAAALNFAVDLREADDLIRARELAAQTVDAYRETLGAEHPYTLYARTNLGIVLRLLGRVAEAEENNRTAWVTLERILGPTHMLTLTCGINLASDLAALENHQGAHDLDSTLLAQCRQLIGDGHPSTLACSLNLSFDLEALGRVRESARLYDETLAAYGRVLGEHPAIVAARARQRANCDVDPMQF